MTITPIRGELRQAAHERLIELANELMRAAQSLILKSGRIMNPDPKVHRRVIAGLTTYRGHALPGSDEVLLIQALLTGTPPEQCLSRAEKVRSKKAARRQKSDETWERIHNSPNPRDAWERTDFSGKRKKKTPQVGTPATVIAFPVVKRPPAKKPISRKERLHQIFNAAHVMERQGLAPEDLPADTDPTTRRLMELLTKAPRKCDPDGDNAA